jgi:hypothetical protein
MQRRQRTELRVHFEEIPQGSPPTRPVWIGRGPSAQLKGAEPQDDKVSFELEDGTPVPLSKSAVWL